MTVCREFDQGVDWAEVRTAVDQALKDAGESIQLGIDEEHPVEDTWGLSPAQIRAQERALRQAGVPADGS